MLIFIMLARFIATDPKDFNTVPLRSANVFNNNLRLKYPAIWPIEIPVQYVNPSTGTIYDTVERGNTWLAPQNGTDNNWLPEHFYQNVKRMISTNTQPIRKPKPKRKPIPMMPRYAEVFVNAPFIVPSTISHSTNTAQY